jgi:hypothetical protein
MDGSRYYCVCQDNVGVHDTDVSLGEFFSLCQNRFVKPFSKVKVDDVLQNYAGHLWCYGHSGS